MLRGIFWLGALAALTLAVALWVARPAVAAACPQCFGLNRIAGRLYMESDATEAQRQAAAAALAAVEQRVRAFYTDIEHMPRALICGSESCYRHIGGHGGSGAVGTFAVVISPQGINPVQIADTLSEVELHGRVGYWRMTMGAIPMWFDQGVDVLVSDDPAYLAPVGRHDRCKAGPIPDMPATPNEWQDELGEEGSILFAQSACQTDLWMLSHGGPKGVTDLLAKVGAGQSFDSLYR